MMKAKLIFAVTLLTVPVHGLRAQDIAGTWQGTIHKEKTAA
jgi:hypothetical protein